MDDADIAMVPMVRPHFGRASHEATMQMPTEYQIHSQLPETV